jgi:hypothetical protein
VAWPFVAQAQRGDRVRRVGVLMGADENDPVSDDRTWFTQALADERDLPFRCALFPAF